MTVSEFKATTYGAYICNLWRALDQLMNALAFGNPRESISSRLGRTSPNCILCKLLHYIESDHCLKAWDREREVVKATYE